MRYTISKASTNILFFAVNQIIIIYVLLAFILLQPQFANCQTAKLDAGNCLAWIKQFELHAKNNKFIRNDIFKGLMGWVALKSKLTIQDIDQLASERKPDIRSCYQEGLDVFTLRYLDYISLIENNQNQKVVLEECAAALMVLDQKARESKNYSLLNLLYFMGGKIGTINANFKDQHKADINSYAAAEKILLIGGKKLQTNKVFSQNLSSCACIGFDIDYLKQISGIK